MPIFGVSHTPYILHFSIEASPPSPFCYHFFGTLWFSYPSYTQTSYWGHLGFRPNVILPFVWGGPCVCPNDLVLPILLPSRSISIHPISPEEVSESCKMRWLFKHGRIVDVIPHTHVDTIHIYLPLMELCISYKFVWLDFYLHAWVWVSFWSTECRWCYNDFIYDDVLEFFEFVIYF